MCFEYEQVKRNRSIQKITKMEAGDKNNTTSSYRLYCFNRCFQNPAVRAIERDEEDEEKSSNVAIHGDSKIPTIAQKRKPRGWKAMPFIFGNETFERLATYGLTANFMVYLMREYHIDQVSAAKIVNIWNGVSNFGPVLGAFVCDAYAGKFRTIAFGSFAALLGMVIVTLTAWLPSLQPLKCQPYAADCEAAKPLQVGVLFLGLGLLSIGTAGIRPCSLPFGVDQFDPTTKKGRKGIVSFYNWYYASFNIVILLTSTVVVYIQDSISWVLGFGIPTLLMISSIVLFFIGIRIYVYIKAEGSVFSRIARVFVAAFKKRGLKLPHHNDIIDGIFYDAPMEDTLSSKLPLTNQFRFLNKAAMIEQNDLSPDGSCVNEWRLCSIQKVEEVKCVLKIIPIWITGVVSFTAMTQQGTFTIVQAMNMDRHLGHFQIPAATISSLTFITIGLWLPIYDRIVIPALRKVTKHEGGITVLQRAGVGLVFSILSMVIAGVVERYRRVRAISNPGSPMSVMWLAPQLVLMGLYEAFNVVGHLELYNKEFPSHMRSIANSLIYCSLGSAFYLTALIISIVQKVTQTRDDHDWLADDLNIGKLDYFYYLVAGIGILNLLYFLYCATRYHYKSPQLKNNNVDVMLT